MRIHQLGGQMVAIAKLALCIAIMGSFGLPVAAQVVDLNSQVIDRDGQPLGPDSEVRRTDGDVYLTNDGVYVTDEEDGIERVQLIQQTPTQPPVQPQPLQDLNTDPNADISDLVPQQQPTPPPPPQQNFPSAQRAPVGATRSSFSSAPTMIGDLFSGGFSGFAGTLTVPFSGYSRGIIVGTPSLPSQADASIAFAFGGDLVPDDVFTTGLGSDLDGSLDGFADTFSILEPLPPNDALTSPGPGFIFDGGTAVYTNNTTATAAQPGMFANNQDWLVRYSYSLALGGQHGVRPAPGPGLSVRRVKLSENYSPEVRNRWFGNFNFFNDVVGGLGDVSRYVLGREQVLIDGLISGEIRAPMAGTYGSTQALDQRPDRSYEFGNLTMLLKGILLRSERFIWSGGLGVAVPTADDTRITNAGDTILLIENKTVHILPFTGLLLRKDRDTSMQAYMQLDVAANGDSVFGDLSGQTLPKLGDYNDSTLLYVDLTYHKTLYRCPRSRRLSGIIGNAELHYSGTLQDADFVSVGAIDYTSLKNSFNVVNGTLGAHFTFGDKLVLTPAMTIPLRDGLDEQFDYEAALQVNYLR